MECAEINDEGQEPQMNSNKHRFSNTSRTMIICVNLRPSVV